MQSARRSEGADLEDTAKDMRNQIQRTVKTAMARQRGLEGREIGEFMKDHSIELTGGVLLAGTELWDIIDSQGWNDGIPGLGGVQLIDPITVLMDHLSDLSVRAPEHQEE